MLEDRRLLAAVAWIGPAAGYWDAAANWSNNAVPTSADDVTINPATAATVTIQAGDALSANSVTLGANNTLSISGGALTTAAGLTNLGNITLGAGCNLTVGGTYNEAAGGTLTMPGGGNPAFPASNSLTNSDFTTPTAGNSTTKPSGWSVTNGGAYLSTQYAYTGTQSLMLAGGNYSAVQTFPATPGASYTASAYAMMPASNPLTGTAYAELQMEFFNASGGNVSTWSLPYDDVVLRACSAAGGPLSGSVGNQGWTHYWTTAVAPAGTVSVKAFVDTHLSGNTGGGAVYFDDVTFGPAVAGASKLTAGNVVNSGCITIGPTNLVTTAGNFTQNAFGTLDIQLGGAPAANITGCLTANNANLAGTLKADLLYDYSPGNTDNFIPITFNSETGGFGNFTLPSGTGYQFAGAVTFTNVVLSAYPTTALTDTINTTGNLTAVPNDVLGIDVQYKDPLGLTSQTQQMLGATGVQLIRIPGGSYSDDWHFNANYTASSENNFGGLLGLIAAEGATGLATIDYGSASPQEGAAELAYALGSPSDGTVIGNGIQWNDTTGQWQTVNWQTVGYWASLRAAAPLAVNDGLNYLRLNHLAPYSNIKYWEVGNEEYGTWEVDHHGTNTPQGNSTGAQHDPATYVAFAQLFAAYAAEITAAADLPAVSIGIDSDDPTGSDYNGWTKTVLTDGQSAGFAPGFISDHNYMYGPGSENDSNLLNGTDTNPASIDDWSTRYTDYENLLKQTLTAQQAASVQMLGTEYNSSYGYGNGSSKQETSLVNGLFIADSIGSMMMSGYTGGCIWDLRDNGWSTTGNLSNTLYGWRKGGELGQLGTNWENLPPSTAGYIAYPGYFGLQLDSKIVNSGGQIVPATSNYTDLETYAVQEPNGDLDLLVVNTNAAANLTEQFNMTGFQPSGSAQVWQYGKAQDLAQSQSATGCAALANFGATLSLSGSNFSYTFPAYSMTVLDLGRATLTITANAAGKTYGSADPAFGVSYSGFAGGDGPSILGGTLSITTSEPGSGLAAVGSYQIIPAGLTSSKYTLSFANGTLSVTPATLTVTAANAARLYGAADPAYSATISGFVGTDTQANSVTGSPRLMSDDTASSPAGNYTISAAAGTLAAQNYSFAFAGGTLTINSVIEGRDIFYGNSAYNGYKSTASSADDAAIDTSKSALLPGQTATYANYTDSTQGINGIMVDVGGLANPGLLSAADFLFAVGDNNSPSGWAAVTAPTVTVRSGAGAGGSARVELIWPDNTIHNQWLQVTVLADANTGLAANDVFYFGSEPGAVLGAGYASFDDIFAVYRAIGNTPSVTPATAADVNHDGMVTFDDIFAVYRAIGGAQLSMITAPAAGPAVAPAVTAAAPAAATFISPAVTPAVGPTETSAPAAVVDIATPAAQPAPADQLPAVDSVAAAAMPAVSAGLALPETGPAAAPALTALVTSTTAVDVAHSAAAQVTSAEATPLVNLPVAKPAVAPAASRPAVIAPVGCPPEQAASGRAFAARRPVPFSQAAQPFASFDLVLARTPDWSWTDWSMNGLDNGEL